MTEKEIFDRWMSLSGKRSEENCNPDRLVGFFQAFRPEGDGLAEAFDEVVGGKELLPRVLELYHATSAGCERELYFVVRHPQSLSKQAAEEWVGVHLQRMKEIGRETGNTELISRLGQLSSVDIVHGKFHVANVQDDLRSIIAEARSDFMLSLTPVQSHALLLEEALYHAACDYFISDYILWPLYCRTTTVIDPFTPYFQLWKHGATMQFVDDRLVRLFVPSLVG